jgi:hypothetical protein
MAIINDARNKNNRNLGNFPRNEDKSTLCEVGIDYAHHEAHDGKHFTISNVWQGVDIATPYRGIVFYMPESSDDYAHLLWTVSAIGTTLVTLEEDVSVAVASNGAVAIPFDETPYNNRRGSANVAELEVGFADTEARISNVPTGTVIWQDVIGSSGGPAGSRSPGGASRDLEFILKKHGLAADSAQTAYILRAQTLVDDNIISMVMDWYEHGDKF